MNRPPGLDSEAARTRLERQGLNELPRSAPRAFIANTAHALAEPMFGLLVVAASIYFALIAVFGGIGLIASYLIEKKEVLDRSLS